MFLHLGIGNHGDRSTKLFSGHKPCYNSQWLLNSHFFKCCIYIYIYIYIYTNLPVNTIVNARLPHPWSGNSQRQETFLAPSANKQTRNYDKECSNHHPSPSTLWSKGMSRSKMKWWVIYTNLPVNSIVRLPILGAEMAWDIKRFSCPLLTSKPATMTQSAQTTISPDQP